MVCILSPLLFCEGHEDNPFLLSFSNRYTGMHSDYTGQGFDQLLDVINKIKNNPDDRRILLSAWNPNDLKLMARPPCHMFAKVLVSLKAVALPASSFLTSISFVFMSLRSFTWQMESYHAKCISNLAPSLVRPLI